MDLENAKIRSIRMTDRDYEILKEKSLQRKLAIGKYIHLLCEEKQQNELSPDIICKLQTIRNLLNISYSHWNKEMKALFEESVADLCGMLKW